MYVEYVTCCECEQNINEGQSDVCHHVFVAKCRFIQSKCEERVRRKKTQRQTGDVIYSCKVNNHNIIRM